MHVNGFDLFGFLKRYYRLHQYEPSTTSSDIGKPHEGMQSLRMFVCLFQLVEIDHHSLLSTLSRFFPLWYFWCCFTLDSLHLDVVVVCLFFCRSSPWCVNAIYRFSLEECLSTLFSAFSLIEAQRLSGGDDESSVGETSSSHSSRLTSPSKSSRNQEYPHAKNASSEILDFDSPPDSGRSSVVSPSGHRKIVSFVLPPSLE